ncbi:MAG: glycine betaine ABC transporter substrate-binding protein [Desulfurivibrionaceae bacterium]
MDLDFVIARLPELIVRMREHLFLTGVSVGFAVLFGIPAGILIVKRKWLRTAVFSFAGIVQTVPSLAMLAILLTVTGRIGVVPAIISLVLYALLPIIQNTVTGFESVSASLLEASEGMGMTRAQKTRLVTIPIAMPVIIAGIKTSAVISVGIATLSAFIGAGGLGEFINRGLSLADNRLILLGAVPAALFALYVSFSITAFAWGRDPRKRRQIPILAGRSGIFVSMLPLLLLLLIAVGGIVYDRQHGGALGDIKIGSKNFTEQMILAEMMAQLIENDTDLVVSRNLNLGGTMICHDAILTGAIDLYPEYTGTALLAILNSETRPAAAEGVYRLVKAEYRRKFGLDWLSPFGFNNTYALAVREEDAANRNWRTISDLASAAGELRAGFTAEFSERPDGYPGLIRAYDFSFGKMVNLDPAIMYEAIREEQVDVITAFSTDSRIEGYNLVLLEDDKKYFPPYFAAPVIRRQTLSRYPEIKEALAPIENLLDEETMRRLNFQVDQEKRQFAGVVREFLEAQGLGADK